jgi:UDP-N-acetylglucosamine acyltransferase
MFSYVTKDVPAYVVASGRPAGPRGINTEGLKRRGFSPEAIRQVREAYRLVYRQGLRLEEAVEEIAARVAEQADLGPLLETLRRSERGLIR